MGTTEFTDLATGRVLTNIEIYYQGQEGEDPQGQQSENPERHIFDLRISAFSNTVFARIYVSEDEEGVLFEMENEEIPVGQIWNLQFDVSLYIPPQQVGVIVSTRTEVRSQRWNPFPGSWLVVTSQNQEQTQ